jgi:hypothetical protein
MNGGGRARILIGMPTDIALRAFVESGAMLELADRYDLFGFKTEGVLGGFPEASGIRDAGVVAWAPWRDRIRYHLSELSIFAGRSRTAVMRAKTKLIGGRRGLLFSALGRRGVYELVDALAEGLVGRVVAIDAMLERTAPDAVIIPYGGLNSFTIDVLKSAHRQRVPVIMLNYNWDNVGSKGLLPRWPDVLCVWGEDMARLAQHVFRLPSDRLPVIGAAHFEHYFDPERMDAAAAEAARLVEDGIPRLLFAGGSRGHAEVPYLEQLEAAIEDGRLPRIRVIYRPHPWRDARRERNFYDVGFKHVEMDPQLAGRFTPETINRNWPGKAKATYAPALSYYPVLLQSVSAIITPLSTLSLEAALVGQPILAMAGFEEEWLKRSLDTFEHIQRLRRLPGVLECRDPATFVDRVRHLLELAANPDVREELREGTRPIVYREDKTTYGQRLVGVVDEVVRSRR